MILVETIIMLGPAPELYPIVTEKFPKFELSFLDTTLLNHTINYVQEFSSKIHILCLEQYLLNVNHIISQYKVPINIIPLNAYEGVGFCLNSLKNSIEADVFIFCKADMFFQDSLKPMLENFLISDDAVHASMYQYPKNPRGNPTIFMDGSSYLIPFNGKDIPVPKYGTITASVEYAFKNFFLCRKRNIFDIINQKIVYKHDNIKCDIFGYKNDLIPLLLQNNMKIKIMQDDNFVVSTIKDVRTQLKFKDCLVCDDRSTLYLDGAKVDGQPLSSDSIIGYSVLIKKKCHIKKSIIMNDTTIESGTYIDNSIIGR